MSVFLCVCLLAYAECYIFHYFYIYIYYYYYYHHHIIIIIIIIKYCMSKLHHILCARCQQQSFNLFLTKPRNKSSISGFVDDVMLAHNDQPDATEIRHHRGRTLMSTIATFKLY